MRLEAPYYLGCLLVIPFFLILSIRAWRLSDQWLFVFSGERKPFLPVMLNMLCVCMTIVSLTLALCGPGIRYEKTGFNSAGTQFVIGIDVSKSMLAEDAVFPVTVRNDFRFLNRLNRARYFALELLSQLQGQKLGVFIFAGSGIEIVPLTGDYGYCRYILRHLNDADITREGSDLGEAIRTGLGMLESSGEEVTKFMVIVSDGEDIESDRSSLHESARYAADKGIFVHTVGVGTRKPLLIPIRTETGAFTPDYYKDENGAYLKTALTEERLKDISDITGGRYFRLNNRSVPKLLSEEILHKTLTMTREIGWLNLSPVFLGVGLFFFIVGEFF